MINKTLFYCKFSSVFIFLLLSSSIKFYQNPLSNLIESKPCDNMIVGAFSPLLDQLTTTNSIKPTQSITDRCPSIRTQTCCSESTISHMTAQMRSSLKLMRYRGSRLEKLFAKITGLANETFNVFLNELTNKDTDCYNQHVQNKIEAIIKEYPNDQGLIDILNKQLSFRLYDKKKMENTFDQLKKLAKTYMGKIEKGNQGREDYYSGFICSACSPNFSKQFSVAENDGVKEVTFHVNKFMCKKVIKNEIAVINSMEIYDHLQKILDLSYCVRKNSKPQKDYSSIDSEQLQMLSVPSEFFPSYLEKRNGCLADEDAFLEDESSDQNCINYCKKGLALFSINMVTLNKVIMAENEIFNMFHNSDQNHYDPDQRIYNHLNDVKEKREEHIESGTLVINPNNPQGVIVTILKEKYDSVFKFKNLKIEVEPYFGMNFYHTPMDPKYYSFTYIFKIMFLVAFSLLLGQI